MELIPKRVSQLWKVWGIRHVIMLSILCQIILTIFGSKRNRSKSSWMRIILWSAYMTSDWATQFLLGTMVSVDDDSKGSISTESIQLRAFWASCLLLHLGGPDTIAAYSLEDNELWSRSCLGMVLNVGVALYILLTYWSNNLLGYISIPMFFVGTVKYVERIWSLRSKSKEFLRDYGIFSKHFLREIIFGIYGSGLAFPSEVRIRGLTFRSKVRNRRPAFRSEVRNRKNFLPLAYALYAGFLCEFIKEQLPSKLNREHSEVISRHCNGEAEDVFRLVQIELRLVYQVLYTKATAFCSLLGILIRIICFILLVATLVIFLTAHVIAPKGSYQMIDIVITRFLIIGAIFVELWSFVILFSSDWRKLWLLQLNIQRNLNNQRKPSVPLTKFEKARDSLALFMTRYPSLEMDPKNWTLSETMGQYNLIRSCFKKATSHRFGVRRVLRLLTIDEMLEKHLNVNVSWVEVNSDLQQLMFDHHKGKSPTGGDKWSDLCWSVLQRRSVPEPYKWSIARTGLGDSILFWHIATDICYHTDDDDFGRQEGEITGTKEIMNICSWVSNYMLYLYVMHPSMVGMVSQEIRTGAYKEVYDIVLHQFNELKGHQFNELKGRDKQRIICKKLLKCEDLVIPPTRGNAGLRLARLLQALREKGWNDNLKWKIIREVWGKMLAHVAIQGDWEEHVHQLRRGGELITYLRLLIFHRNVALMYLE